MYVPSDRHGLAPTKVAGLPQTLPNTPISQPRQGLLRRYQITCVNSAGDITDIRRAAPAIPLFETAFSAFARGSLIATDEGAVAVEDLLPGMGIHTTHDGVQPLLWIGSIWHVTNISATRPSKGLTRVSTDSFGLGRPVPDLLLGPGARLFQENHRAATEQGQGAACIPAANFLDGHSVIEVTPVSSVQLFHIVLPQHAIISVNGLECETFHPGREIAQQSSVEDMATFLTLFPHCNSVSDFGAVNISRLPFDDVSELQTA